MPVRAVRANRVDLGFHLGAVEEIVRADERESAVGHHLRFVIENRRKRDRLDLAAVALHDEQGPRRRIMVLFEAADAGRGEHDPPVGQFGGVDIVKRPVGQPLGRPAVQGHSVDVEEGIAAQGHRRVQRPAVVTGGRRTDRPLARVDQQLRRRLRVSDFQQVQLAADFRRAGNVELGVGSRPSVHAEAHAPSVAAQGHVHAAVVADVGNRLRPAEILARFGKHDAGLKHARPRRSLGRPTQRSPGRHAHRPDDVGLGPPGGSTYSGWE